jgi:translocation and assembly module TamA
MIPLIRRSAAQALLALVLAPVVLLGSGCAMLQSALPNAVPAEAVPAGPPAVLIDIDAPGDLKTLLERYLDLSRLGTLARGKAISDTEITRLIEGTPAQVRELLQTEGYFAPELSIAREPPLAQNAPERVRLVVKPGPQTVVGRVDIQVEGALSLALDAGDTLATDTLATLRSRWLMQPGARFRNALWSDAKNAALARLRAAGYAAATWSGTAVDIDAAAGSARLYVVADSGPLFRSGEVVIEGLQLHDRETVMHLAAFKRGTPVTEALLLDFQDRMVKAGLFERVSITLDADPDDAAAARILVRLTELSLHQLTTGVGVSANTGPRVTLEHTYRRVLGYAATAHNKFELGQARQAWDGTINTHPGEGLYRNLIGVAIERLKSDTDTVLSQRLRVGRTQDSTRIDRLYFAEVERSSRRADASRTDSTAYSLNYHWVWRDIDSPILPTRGSTWSLQAGAGAARDSNGKSGGFARTYGRVTGYLPLGQSWYSQARLELGRVFAPSGLEIPDPLRFRAGGDDSVRGYAYRSLGPIVDGNVTSGSSLLTLSFELARPIVASIPSLWGAVFVDAGNAAADFRNLKLAVGSGVGLRWSSPVGPLRLDWAYGHELSRARLHISVGIVF